jgi:hypothetical protein
MIDAALRTMIDEVLPARGKSVGRTLQRAFGTQLCPRLSIPFWT